MMDDLSELAFGKDDKTISDEDIAELAERSGKSFDEIVEKIESGWIPPTIRR
jgi:hypothetical protein